MTSKPRPRPQGKPPGPEPEPEPLTPHARNCLISINDAMHFARYLKLAVNNAEIYAPDKRSRVMLKQLAANADKLHRQTRGVADDTRRRYNGGGQAKRKPNPQANPRQTKRAA